MRRSYELLIAEQLQKGGYINDIQRAISQMSNLKGYSSVVYDKKQGYSFTIVTVVITERILIIFSIDNVDETVELIAAPGIDFKK